MTGKGWPTGTLGERVQWPSTRSGPPSHGRGDVELLRIEGDVVVVRLVGACHGCRWRLDPRDFVGERVKLYARRSRGRGGVSALCSADGAS